jgi:DNA-3-methyladenine glycosylase II
VIINETHLPDNSSSGNVYEDLIRSITSQQLSTNVARVIFGRLINLYGGLVPTPHQLFNSECENLRRVGYSNQKSRYIKNVAEYFLNKEQHYDYWSAFTNEEVVDMLTTIKGVGKWTAQMILITSLERPDVMPVDDLGIQMGMKQLYGLKEEKKVLKVKMLEIAELWRPYRTYACRYIWAAKDNMK